jgi:GTP-binding protein
VGVSEIRALPPVAASEIAFAGRSNVGKSSLINALTGQRTLARASNTPGRTRQLNFFALGNLLTLVDLPGYGYAKAPKGEVRRWNQLIYDYLRGRPGLRRVMLLLDARHGIKPADGQVMDLLDGLAVSYQAVLTKCDKLAPAELAAARAAVAGALARRPAAHPVVHATSAATASGIAELRAELAALAAEKPDAL